MKAILCSAILAASLTASPAIAARGPVAGTVMAYGEDDLPRGCFRLITGQVYCLPMPIE